MELAKKFLGFRDMRLQAIDFEKGITNGDFNPEEFFCFPKKRLVRGIQLGKGVGVFESESLLAHRCLICRDDGGGGKEDIRISY
jgi:hypothetical protein